jgi:hypothetical protein
LTARCALAGRSRFFHVLARWVHDWFTAPGPSLSVRLTVEGTALMDNDRLAVLNPLYEIEAGRRPARKSEQGG